MPAKEVSAKCIFDVGDAGHLRPPTLFAGEVDVRSGTPARQQSMALDGPLIATPH
jgi:hypothetical protein